MITLTVSVEGVAMDEAAASKLAAKIQSSVAPLLKVAPNDLVVEVSVAEGEEEGEDEMTPAQFADQAAKASGLED